MFSDKLSFFFSLWLALFFPVQGYFQGYLELTPSLLVAVANAWVKQCKERVYFSSQFEGTSIMAAGAWGGPSHCIHTQEAEGDDGTSGIPVHGMVLPKCRLGLLISINLLSNSLTDMPKDLFPWWFSVPSIWQSRLIITITFCKYIDVLLLSNWRHFLRYVFDKVTG